MYWFCLKKVGASPSPFVLRTKCARWASLKAAILRSWQISPDTVSILWLLRSSVRPCSPTHPPTHPPTKHNNQNINVSCRSETRSPVPRTTSSTTTPSSRSWTCLRRPTWRSSCSLHLPYQPRGQPLRRRCSGRLSPRRRFLSVTSCRRCQPAPPRALQ